jgi:DNA adenine methylase
VTLTLVQWVGGKGNQLNDLLPLIPYDHGYCEPFGGGASVLMNRPRSEVEVYNDINGDVVALFRCMQDYDAFKLLQRRVEHTLWSKEEFRDAIAIQQAGRHGDRSVTMIDKAWALLVIQNQGVSGTHCKSEGNWSRSFMDSKNTEKWLVRQGKLEAVHQRFRYVQVDSQDALSCMTYWDAPDMVFYVDPPYVLDTRGNRLYYENELQLGEHEEMVKVLLKLKGKVVLSGYQSAVYDPLEAHGWEATEYKAYGYSKLVRATDQEEKPLRIERVWRNPAALTSNVQMHLEIG